MKAEDAKKISELNKDSVLSDIFKNIKEAAERGWFTIEYFPGNVEKYKKELTDLGYEIEIPTNNNMIATIRWGKYPHEL